MDHERQVKGLADISNFANHFTNEMVRASCGTKIAIQTLVMSFRVRIVILNSVNMPRQVGNLRHKDSDTDTCDEFSDFGYVAPVSKNLLNSTISHYR